jgi:hypothetical protein
MILLNTLAVLQFIGYGGFNIRKTLLIFTCYTSTSNESKFGIGYWLQYLSYPAVFQIDARGFLAIPGR